MEDFGSKLKRFFRSNTPQFAVMLFLALINYMTTSFPWAVFPIGAMMISVLISASNIFLSDGSSSASEMMDRDTRRAEREQRRAERAGAGNTIAASTPARSKEMNDRLNQARAYKREIDNLVNTTTDPLRKDKLRELANDTNTWIKTVEEMTARIDGFKSNTVVQQDLVSVPESVKRLTAQLASETDPRVKATIEKTLATRADQLQSLQKLQSLMRQAEVQLESSVAALGTIYSQALATQSTTRVADYSQLSAELDEQSKLLRDQLEALEEVKLGREKTNLG